MSKKTKSYYRTKIQINKEVSKFIVENFENSANAIFTILDVLKLNDINLYLSINYNAKHNQTVKLLQVNFRRQILLLS